jgi:quinol monooxygenase YgiN
MATQDRTVSIAPYLKAHSGKIQQAKAACDRLVEATKSEAGCLYYGFSFNGDSIFCREAYKDAEGLLAHLEHVGPLIAELQKVTDFSRIEIHGVESELAKLRKPLADFKPEYFTLEYGFCHL